LRLFCRYGYSGDCFQGFSRELGRRTVEGTILDILVKTGAAGPERPPRHASRTDRGVSALGNVFSLESERAIERPAETLEALNALAAGHGLLATGYCLVGDGREARDAA